MLRALAATQRRAERKANASRNFIMIFDGGKFAAAIGGIETILVLISRRGRTGAVGWKRTGDGKNLILPGRAISHFFG